MWKKERSRYNKFVCPFLEKSTFQLMHDNGNRLCRQLSWLVCRAVPCSTWAESMELLKRVTPFCIQDWPWWIPRLAETLDIVSTLAHCVSHTLAIADRDVHDETWINLFPSHTLFHLCWSRTLTTRSTRTRIQCHFILVFVASPKWVNQSISTSEDGREKESEWVSLFHVPLGARQGFDWVVR